MIFFMTEIHILFSGTPASPINNNVNLNVNLNINAASGGATAVALGTSSGVANVTAVTSGVVPSKKAKKKLFSNQTQVRTVLFVSAFRFNYRHRPFFHIVIYSN